MFVRCKNRNNPLLSVGTLPYMYIYSAHILILKGEGGRKENLYQDGVDDLYGC